MIRSLPDDLWIIIGDYHFSDVLFTEDSVELLLRPAKSYYLVFDAQNEMFVQECTLH